MKLDKVREDMMDRNCEIHTQIWQDNSGTIEREEFLSLPQVSSNPLATRLDATCE
jgi:hypothetical protein